MLILKKKKINTMIKGKLPNLSAPQAYSQAETKWKQSEKRLRFKPTSEERNSICLGQLDIRFAHRLKDLDTSLIHFSSDTTFIPVTNYHFLTDTSQKKLTLQYNWKENTQYNLIIEKDFAQDTLGRAL